jgi:DNA-binding transcriptional ArsR family regulator
MRPRIPDEIRDKIRRCWRRGEPRAVIAARFSIAGETVRRIVRNTQRRRERSGRWIDARGRSRPSHHELHDGLDEVILRYVGRFPRSSREIYDLVIEDYGSVSIRVFYRHINKLREAKLVLAVAQEPHGRRSRLFYVRGPK